MWEPRGQRGRFSSLCCTAQLGSLIYTEHVSGGATGDFIQRVENRRCFGREERRRETSISGAEDGKSLIKIQRGDTSSTSLRNVIAPAKGLSWLERRPTHRKVVGSIPGQDMHLGCGFVPVSGRVREATDGCFSLSRSLSLFPCPLLRLSKINQHTLQ